MTYPHIIDKITHPLMLNEYQQFKKVLDDSKHVLLVFGHSENTDALSGALAIAKLIEKQGKQADIACPNFVLPKNLQFLNGVEEIKSELTHLQKFIIKVDVSQTKIETISYDIKDNWLSIYLTPKKGNYTKDNLRTSQSSFKYDLIIVLGTPDLSALNGIFLNNTDLFYNTPIINIDCNAGNEHFGQINIIDINATSVSEIIFDLIKNLGEAYIDTNIATTILTGIISATQSFKTNNVTPHTLQIAGQLINHGAEREKIIQNLYRTKSIGTLKLWGVALSRIKNDTTKKFAWTTILRDHFLTCNATEEDLNGLASELLQNSPEIDLSLILFEGQEKEKSVIKGILFSKKHLNCRAILRTFEPKGDKNYATIILENKTIADAEKEVTEEIKKQII